MPWYDYEGERIYAREIPAPLECMGISFGQGDIAWIDGKNELRREDPEIFFATAVEQDGPGY